VQLVHALPQPGDETVLAPRHRIPEDEDTKEIAWFGNLELGVSDAEGIHVRMRGVESVPEQWIGDQPSIPACGLRD
jgi:hypothetical protein